MPYMKQLRPLVFGVIGLIFVGQGCLSAPAAPKTVTAPPPQPLSTEGEIAAPRPVQEILGIAVPATGVAVFSDVTAEKQDGAVFVGQSYRLTPSAKEADQPIGRATILNITDPTRDPQKALHDPMWNLLRCVGSETTYGLHCDLAKPVAGTVNGLSVQSYVVSFSRGTILRPESSGKTTVWLVQLPSNTRAWLYVYPIDLQDQTAKTQLESWIKALKQAP